VLRRAPTRMAVALAKLAKVLVSMPSSTCHLQPSSGRLGNGSAFGPEGFSSCGTMAGTTSPRSGLLCFVPRRGWMGGCTRFSPPPPSPPPLHGQLRLGRGRLLEENFYIRGAGTRVFFFTLGSAQWGRETGGGGGRAVGSSGFDAVSLPCAHA
jgi:hypothetical protein